MNNKNLKLKIALLSCFLVTASMNAITGNIPEMAKTFTTVPLYVVELISTLPSLFQMIAILLGRFISKKIGYKNTVLLGILFCGIGGIIPIYIQNIYVILFTRGIFGFGVGMITTTLLTLFIYFFDGNTRSTMIGLQGSIGGVGSFLSTFIAGRLLVYGWNVSFYAYFIAFIILFIVVAFVPTVNREEVISDSTTVTKKESRLQGKAMLKMLFYTGLLFISMSLSTLYIIKASTLITTLGYGTVQDGSTVIMLISIGSLCSGAMYGKIVSKIKSLSLPLFYSIVIVACVLAGISNTLVLTLISGFLLGFGLMAFVPYFLEIIHQEFAQYGEVATSIILVGQSLGAFTAPYLGSILGIFTNITGVFMLMAIFFGILTILSLVLVKVSKKKETCIVITA